MAIDNTSNTVIAEKQQINSEEQKRVIGRPFQPGQSGNPNGRPKKGQALTDLMREMMDEQPEIKKAIMARLMKGAAEGDIAFIREVLDRLEGKPIQKNENKDITSLELSYGNSKNNEPATKAGASTTDVTHS